MDRIEKLIIDTRTVEKDGTKYEYIILKKTLHPKDEQTEPLIEKIKMNNDNTKQVKESKKITETPKPKIIKKERRSKTQKKKKERNENEEESSTQIQKVLTKYVPGSSVVSLQKTFKYFVPSKELFFKHYPEQPMYLVKWQNFSIVESTWILESEATKKIDKRGLIEKFNKRWTLPQIGSAAKTEHILKEVFPLTEESVPANDLVPEKIILELPQKDENGLPILMYRVKWLGKELFLSDELSSFFDKERNKSLLQRWKFERGPFPLELNEYQQQTIDEIKKGIDDNNDIIISGGFGKRTSVLAFISEQICQSENGASCLIMCTEKRMDYYKNQLPYLFPGVPLTFIDHFPRDENVKSVIDMELYDENGNIKPQIVVFSCKSFIFKKTSNFKYGIIDIQEPNHITIKSTRISLCNHIIGITDDEKVYNKMKFLMKIKGKGEIRIIEIPQYEEPKVSSIFILIKMQQKQTAAYLQTEEEVKGCEDVSIEDMRRVLLFPSISSYSIGIKGVKMTHVQKIVNFLIEVKKKVAILSPIPQLLEALKPLIKCELIGWDNEISQSKRMCEEFNKNESTKILVDTNCNSQGVDLSGSDYIVLLDSDYTEDKIEEIKQKMRVGTKKSIKVLYFVITNTIDETIAVASRTSSIIAKEQYFSILTTTMITVDQLINEIISTTEKTKVIKLGTEEEIKEFNEAKEKEMKRIEEKKNKENKTKKIERKKRKIDDVDIKDTYKEERKRRIETFLNEVRLKKINELKEENVSFILDEETKQLMKKIQEKLKEKFDENETNKISKTIICYLLRFGTKIDEENMILFNKYPIDVELYSEQIIKELTMNDISEKIKTNDLAYRRIFETVSNMQNKMEEIYEDDKQNPWNSTCDLVLLEEIKRIGLECPKIWIKNPFLQISMIKFGIKTEQEQITFVESRYKSLIGLIEKKISMDNENNEEYQEKRDIKESQNNSTIEQSTPFNNKSESYQIQKKIEEDEVEIISMSNNQIPSNDKELTTQEKNN
ncbi:hypothetical protein, conserved [Entamoeba dispar SAW760]|uniref:Helicase C-terminal domain-containing protein n=1 Tax=Entamoeba dispar (strain ATCC PRA-260 / SAW760) TaxID=370354 RepID=B0EAB0_ENTDS|nr:uncharacterized protein EDI_137450 [Entamoeba dispar SAW760]EDR28536.1 hypothetical protein, conserved [Entamoeba dispar SAW760]|eukprot:EDR28536.1 hypothetical protein, conserved [Entamoeba dispar SAW760]